MQISYVKTKDKDFIDLRSDTIFNISDEMRVFIANAKASDMLYNEDQNVNKLEQILSELFNMEDCIWTPSCTMANLIGLLLSKNCLGCEILLGKNSHINKLERKNALFIGGFSYNLLPDYDGYLEPNAIQNAITKENEFYPEQVSIALENSHNLAGGVVFSPQYLKSVCEVALKNHLRVHLDGARIFNASVALNQPLSEWSLNKKGPDTISISLSKCLSTPSGGALLLKNYREKKRAKYLRKAIGGTMHTGAGFLAAAAVFQLNKWYDGVITSQIKKIHDLAKYLSVELNNISQDFCVIHKVQTNIVYLSFINEKLGKQMKSSLHENKILCSFLGKTDMRPNEEYSLRFVVHKDISKDDIDHVLSIINLYASSGCSLDTHQIVK